MTITFAIRTADRRPKPNYLGQTVRSLVAGGVPASRLHVFPTDPDVAWLDGELGDLPVVRHVPASKRTPNGNGVALVSALDAEPADWLLMLEDDIEVCADFEASVLGWLAAHEQPSIRVYRFCAFGTPFPQSGSCRRYALREQRGSQAIALRAEDARAFAQWATEHHEVWRPRLAPFQNQRTTGFDKLVGYWALATWPEQSWGYVSRPHLVKHVGVQSGLHRGTVTNDRLFSAMPWRPRGAEVAV